LHRLLLELLFGEKPSKSSIDLLARQSGRFILTVCALNDLSDLMEAGRRCVWGRGEGGKGNRAERRWGGEGRRIGQEGGAGEEEERGKEGRKENGKLSL
jgi:hypothetical protein